LLLSQPKAREQIVNKFECRDCVGNTYYPKKSALICLKVFASYAGEICTHLFACLLFSLLYRFSVLLSLPLVLAVSCSRRQILSL